jgi:hypothetical protein
MPQEGQQLGQQQHQLQLEQYFPQLPCLGHNHWLAQQSVVSPQQWLNSQKGHRAECIYATLDDGWHSLPVDRQSELVGVSVEKGEI